MADTPVPTRGRHSLGKVQVIPVDGPYRPMRETFVEEDENGVLVITDEVFTVECEGRVVLSGERQKVIDAANEKNDALKSALGAGDIDREPEPPAPARKSKFR